MTYPAACNARRSTAGSGTPRQPEPLFGSAAQLLALGVDRLQRLGGRERHQLVNPPIGRGDGIQCGRQITSGVSPEPAVGAIALVVRRKRLVVARRRRPSVPGLPRNGPALGSTFYHLRAEKRAFKIPLFGSDLDEPLLPTRGRSAGFQ